MTSEVASLVHVIDTASAKVIKNIKVGKRPRRFAITPDGTQLWVTNELDASVSIISTQDHSVIGTVKFELKGARAERHHAGGHRDDAATASAPSSALGRANHVAFVDVASRKVTDTVLVGKRAWNVALNKAEHAAVGRQRPERRRHGGRRGHAPRRSRACRSAACPTGRCWSNETGRDWRRAAGSRWLARGAGVGGATFKADADRARRRPAARARARERAYLGHPGGPAATAGGGAGRGAASSSRPPARSWR